jgi:hypothetical protein
MTFDKFFIKRVGELMLKAITEGKTWVAYPAFSDITGDGDLQFFSAKKDAEDLCIEKRSKNRAFSHMEVPSVYAGLLKRIKVDVERDDISYYVICSDGFISATLKSNIDQNPLYVDDERFDSLFENEFNIGKPLNVNDMNQDNQNYLQNTLKYHGFGDLLNAKLEENIKSGVPQFSLEHNEAYDGGKMRYSLQFGKSQHREMYFLNKYDALLTKPDGREISQTFYFDNGRAFTKKEAFNLLDGRSVNRDFDRPDGSKYNAWVKLDFGAKTGVNYQLRRFHQNYGYDLEKTLEKLPIAELRNDDQKSIVVRSLKRGDLHAVNFAEGGADSKRFIAADPEFKGIRIYDDTMKEITTQMRNSRQVKELQKSPESSGKGLRV